MRFFTLSQLLLQINYLLRKDYSKERMKGSSKYNLLAKNESKTEKDQEEWVEMQSVSNWHGKAANSNAKYIKFEEQQSEIDHDNVSFNKGNGKSTIPSTQNKKVIQSSLNMEKRMTYLQNQSLSNNLNSIPQQQNASKIQVASQKISNQQSSMKSQQRLSQAYQISPQNSYNNYNYNQQNQNKYPTESNFSLYDQSGNRNQPNHGPQEYKYDQYDNFRQSQMPYNQNYPVDNLTSQQYQSQIRQSSMNSPNIKSSVRSSTRKGIPEMTVNCEKCTFTQSVPGNTQIYICCICNQINECYPLYGVFTCGICRANVIYPHGTSRLIKCTKCQTVNKVNPEPSKRLEEVITLGKETIPHQEEHVQHTKQIEEKSKMKMSRFQPGQEQFHTEVKAKRNEQKPIVTQKIDKDQPFKILPAQKTQPILQNDFFNQNNMTEITEDKQLKREFTQSNTIQFKQELIDFEQFAPQQSGKDTHKQLLELSEKFDQNLNVSRQTKTQNLSLGKQNQGKIHHQEQVQYPTIFDD